MSKPEEAKRDAQIRAAAYSGQSGNGSLAYLDTHDLKPKSLFNAALGGFLGMGLVGGFAGGTLGLMVDEKREKSKEDGKTALYSTMRYTMVGGLVAGVVGGVAAVINARIHNEWAEKMTDKAFAEMNRPENYTDRITQSRESENSTERGI